MKRNIPLLILSLIVFFACTKEENNSIPVITFHAPQYLETFTVFDSIVIQATVSDENTLANVRVNLTNSEFIPVSPAQVFYPEGKDYELSTVLKIDNGSLESGHFYVLIRADNGDDFKNKYQEIIIQGLEKEFTQLVVLTKVSGNTLNIMGSEDLNSVMMLSTLPGDFTASAISSEANLLFIAGKNILNILAFDLTTNTVDWQKQQTPGLPMHHPGCLYFDGLLYTTYNFDFIHGYSESGQVQYDLFIDEFDAPESIYRHGDFILTEFQKKNAVDPFIATTFALTGKEKQRRLINDDVIDFLPMDEDNVLVVFNTDDQGAIYRYDVQHDVLTFRKNVPEKLNSAVGVSGGAIVLAGNNNLYIYSETTGSLNLLLEQGATTLAWEELQGQLLTVYENKLERFIYPEMVNQKTLLFSDTILDLQIQYSK